MTAKIHGASAGSLPAGDQTSHSSGVVSRLLKERLLALNTQLNGLPPHAVAFLRAIVQEEVSTVQQEQAAAVAAAQAKHDQAVAELTAKLTQKVAAIKERHGLKMRDRVASEVTDATVSKAFRSPKASSTTERPAVPTPPASGEQGGAA